MTKAMKNAYRCFGVRSILLSGMILAAGLFASTTTPAQVFNKSNNPTSVPMQVSLQEGKVLLTGSKGKYTGKVVVQGSLANTWAVLTDYDHYEKFMPNVTESRLIQNNRNQKVFEQIQVFNIIIGEKTGKVRIAVTENPLKEIKFKLVQGDLKSLQGFWKISPISSNSFLLTHQVTVEPNIKSSFNRNLFYSVYEDTLENTLMAVKEEIGNRSRAR